MLKNKNKKYVQGIYTCKNPKKYIGTTPIIFRSRMELKAFRYLDNNPNVLSWSSESVVIPYVSPKDGKTHRYFVDLVAKLKSKDGEIKKLLIEVKPERQTKPPTISAKKKQKTILYENYTYAINCAKWSAAKEWCGRKGYIFIILNEKHLN